MGLLTESCAEDTVCPLVEDKPVKSGPCCHTCPTYGDGGLEALEAECNRRAVEKAALEGELCPSVCVCVQDGPCPLIMQVQSEPFCGEGVSPVAKEGVCGLTCPE